MTLLEIKIYEKTAIIALVALTTAWSTNNKVNFARKVKHVIACDCNCNIIRDKDTTIQHSIASSIQLDMANTSLQS